MYTTPVIKICGLKDPDIAVEAVRLGAAYIGLMMYQQSKRYIDIDTATIIADVVKAVNGIPVNVFVDATADEMLANCQKTGVTVVQLHGAIARREHHKLPNEIQRIYVLHVDSSGHILEDVDEGISTLNSQRDLLLFDGVKGGSGQPFAWEKFVNPYTIPFFLAGGLSTDNVATAIKICRPNGVDVSSHVENKKGDKDKNRIAAFIAQVKGVKK